VRGERCDTSDRLQDAGSDLFPKRRAGDLGVEDVVHRHGLGGNPSAGIDEESAALVIEAPLSTTLACDVLPANFTDIVWTVPCGLKVYDTNSQFFHLWRFSARSVVLSQTEIQLLPVSGIGAWIIGQ
jgi:hypothetical protein